MISEVDENMSGVYATSEFLKVIENQKEPPRILMMKTT